MRGGANEREQAPADTRAEAERLLAEATKAHRADMQRQGLPHDEPITEIIIPFPAAPQPQAKAPEHEKMTEEERVAFAMQCRCCR